MLPGDRLRKTEAGRQALATRSDQLSAQLRTLLLLIYGEKTALEYSEMAARLAVGRNGLIQLITLGFVEIIPNAASAPVPAPAAPPPAPVPPPAPAPETQTAHAEAVAPPAGIKDEKALYHLLYPEFVKTVASLGLRGMFLQMKVERAMSAHELFALCHDVETALNNAKGQTAGAEFTQRVNFLLAQAT